MVDCCSNDYLGFSQHPALKQAASEAIERYGTGTGGSRLIGGTLPLHQQLEERLARFKQCEAALVFNSGYQGNVGLLSALVDRHDTIFADRLNHASLNDGALLSRARLVRYPHLDMDTLEKRLQESEGIKWLVSDTVFSMDGDQAPLKRLYDLACNYDAWLVLDEAHATGIFGDQHRSGLWETTGLPMDSRVIVTGTFSKALGSFGAYVAGAQTVINTLINKSHGFIYSTALPPAVIAANLKVLDLVEQDPGPTQTLWDNVGLFCRLLQEAGIDVVGQSPIIPLQVGDEERALAYSKKLFERGFFVQAIRPPTVPDGQSRLRITLGTGHTPAQIQELARALVKVMTS